jgi:hypothetical protein
MDDERIITISPLFIRTLPLYLAPPSLDLPHTHPWWGEVSSQPRETARGERGKGEKWGPVDSSSLLWWVIDNMVGTDSWPSIANVGCSLIRVGVGEERVRKVLALRGLWWVERQAGSTRWTRWPNGIKCGPHGGKRSKTKSSTRACAG